MVKSYSITLAAAAQRLSASFTSEAQNLPFRQLLLTVTGAGATVGDSATSAATGTPLTVGAAPVSLGPFETGPVKLSDLYAVGAGATLQVLGVPF